jgi:hypothetical protein
MTITKTSSRSSTRGADDEGELDEIGQQLQAEQQKYAAAVTARRDAFFNEAAAFINDYRARHLDLEWDDIDAVFKRIHAENRAAKRGGTLSVVNRTLH